MRWRDMMKGMKLTSQSKCDTVLFYSYYLWNIFKSKDSKLKIKCHISLLIIFGWIDGIKRNSFLFCLSFFSSYNWMTIVHKVNRYIFFI